MEGEQWGGQRIDPPEEETNDGKQTFVSYWIFTSIKLNSDRQAVLNHVGGALRLHHYANDCCKTRQLWASQDGLNIPRRREVKRSASTGMNLCHRSYIKNRRGHPLVCGRMLVWRLVFSNLNVAILFFCTQKNGRYAIYVWWRPVDHLVAPPLKYTLRYGLFDTRLP